MELADFTRRGRVRRRWIAATVGCGLVIAAGWSLWRTPVHAVERVDRDLADLAAVAERARAGEARFWGFPYGATTALRAGAAPLSADVRLETARIEKLVGERRTPHDLHTLGVALAIEGRIDESINALTEAVSRDAADPSAWSDLAAGYLARGRPDDLSGASDAAQRALLLAAASASARFNRALALERLHLDREAAVEWQQYLRKDPRSPWSVEAQAHVARLSLQRDRFDWAREEGRLRGALERRDRDAVRRIVAAFPQQTREFVLDTLAPEWARLLIAADDASERALEKCRDLADAVADRGDRFALDAVDAIAHASPSERAAFANAHIAFALGRQASSEYRYGEADRALADVERHLAGRSPLALWASMLRAVVLYQRNDLDRAGDHLVDLRAKVAGRPYPALLGQIDWALGVVNAARGDFNGAFDKYRTALATFEPTGEFENISSVQSLLAETTRMLGDAKGSWSLEISALSHLHEVQRPQRRQTVVMMASLAALRQGRPSAALDFQNRFLDAAREMRNRGAVAEALLNRARVYRQLQEIAAARIDLAAAARELESATELGPGVAPFLHAQLQMEAALDAGPAEYDRPLQQFSEALTYFRASRPVWLPRVYLARGRFLLRHREYAAAEADLLAGIDALEAQRKTVSSESLRVSYLDETWDLFDEMIGLLLDQKRDRDAFRFAERSHARSLLDSIGENIATPLAPAAIAAAMPDDAVMVYFVSVKGHLGVWLLGKTTDRFLELSTNPDEVEHQARAYRRELETGRDARADTLGAALYRELIEPVRSILPAGATLVIVPDRALHQVPFASLRDGASGPFLVERHAIVFAPNARLFVSGAPDRARRTAFDDALIVGNPSIDSSLGMPPLPGAEREAGDVALLYPGATPLIRQAATRSRFLDAAPKASVIHVAAHAIANEEFPDLSRLFLAGDGDMSGALTVRDIGNLRFSKTQLVVLAACGTASGATYRGEGVTSLARPFLARGVPQVVGTLWQIDDQTSRRLFTEFHRGYVTGLPAAQALRQAQLAIIKAGTNGSSSWAAAVLLGSATGVIR